MITDEKRREIAGNLRYCAEMCNNAGVGVLDSDVLNALDIHCGDTDGVSSAYDVEKLADLIDRPTARNIADFDRESFKCSRCGYRVLSIDGAPDAAKLVAPEGGVIDFGYCPNCDSEVVDDARL